MEAAIRHYRQARETNPLLELTAERLSALGIEG
jgi:uncharacterized protein YjiS (DUF1127 family)